MIIKQLILIGTLLFCLGLTELQAQEAIPTSGGNASGSGGSVSFSVGQVVYITDTGISGSVAEGVQQPYEISVVTGIDAARGINLKILAYPNPTTSLLKLSVGASHSPAKSSLSYFLYSMDGRLLENEKITRNETIIKMDRFIPAAYLLRISENNTEIKIFKIIKK